MSATLWVTNLGMVVFLLVGWPVVVLWLACVPKHRAGWQQKLGFFTPEQHEKRASQESNALKRVWIHAVSVGEFNAIRPVVERLIRCGHPVVITTTTQTGQALAQLVFGNHPQVLVAFCPWDIRWAVQRACEQLRPDVLLIAETELWPNLIDCVSRTAPVVLINGRLSDRSYRGYRRFKWWLQPMLCQLSAVFAQSEADAQRYTDLGAPNVSVMGNLKMDGAATPADDSVVSCLATVLGLPHHRENMVKAPVLVLASTHPGEEEQFLSWIREFLMLFPEGRLLVVPRHPERGNEVVQLLSQGLMQPVGQRSQATEANPATQSVVVVDSIGELNACYALAHGAIVGGSFTPKRGGQNPLEPIAQRIPVVYGPYMANFRAIVGLLQQAGVGCQVDCALHAGHTLLQWLQHPDTYQQQVDAGATLLAQHNGVTERLMRSLAPYLND